MAGVGTGGTVTSVGDYLKSQNPNIKAVAVEPADSPVLSKGTPGAHKIQGIGAGVVPDVLNTGVYDEVIPVTNDAAFAAGKKSVRPRVFWRAFLPAPQCGSLLNWQSVPRTRARPSSTCCRTRAIVISLRCFFCARE